ncbi:hypothetical protein ACFL1J_06710 [Pseudomonadota bacterium]
MLRILVISLVVANLLLLAFQGSKPDVPPKTKAIRTAEKDPGIPTIHLFSEMMKDQDLMTGNRQCFSLGPFHSSDDRDETRTRLLEVSTRISERQTEALVEKGYWVFMPPYVSMLEANEELLSLQALGLKDIGIIYDGEWEKAISLGYFLRQENALKRKKALEDKGYEALMRVRRQGEPRYWLDYEQTPGSGLVALDMQNRPNDFMQRPVPCPDEDMFEFTGSVSQEPVEEVAQLQIPGEENEQSPDQGEESGIAEVADNGLQEGIETSPEQAIKTDSQNDIEATPEDAIEIEPEEASDTGQEDASATGPEDVLEPGTGSADEIKPRRVMGTGPEGDFGGESESTEETETGEG